jgi:hypothetical protein
VRGYFLSKILYVAISSFPNVHIVHYITIIIAEMSHHTTQNPYMSHHNTMNQVLDLCSAKIKFSTLASYPVNPSSRSRNIDRHKVHFNNRPNRERKADAQEGRWRHSEFVVEEIIPFYMEQYLRRSDFITVVSDRRI